MQLSETAGSQDSIPVWMYFLSTQEFFYFDDQSTGN